MLLSRDPLVCREFVELVTDYLDGALPRRDRRRFERHLTACGDCHAYMEQMLLTIRAAGDLPPEPPQPEVREHLLAAFRELRGEG
jgi:anti-sigma factor RsiW